MHTTSLGIKQRILREGLMISTEEIILILKSKGFSVIQCLFVTACYLLYYVLEIRKQDFNWKWKIKFLSSKNSESKLFELDSTKAVTENVLENVMCYSSIYWETRQVMADMRGIWFFFIWFWSFFPYPFLRNSDVLSRSSLYWEHFYLPLS